MSGCRIGNIYPKSGGVVRQIPVAERDDFQKGIVSLAATTAGLYEPGEIEGCVVFAWASDGSSATSFKMKEAGAIASILLPSFIADALRAKMIESGEWLP